MSLRLKTPKVASTRKKETYDFFAKSRTNKVAPTREKLNMNETSNEEDMSLRRKTPNVASTRKKQKT